MLRVASRLIGGGAVAFGVPSSLRPHFAEAKASKGQTHLREKDFPLSEHHHGKAKVRVLKVNREKDGMHQVSEFNVNTRLFAPVYGRVFTQEENAGLVATDTQKNTVYIIAQRTQGEGCELQLSYTCTSLPAVLHQSGVRCNI